MKKERESKQEKLPSFQEEQVSESLETVVSAVHKVSHEDVTVVWQGAASPEQLNQVIELTVNITTDSHWSRHRLHIALFNQKLLHLNSLR